MRFDEGVVVGHPRPGVRLGDPKVVEELGDGPGDHGAATVGVDDEAVRGGDFVLVTGFADEPASDLLRFALCERPANDLAEKMSMIVYRK
jgi:hypothetical protein